MTPVRSKIFYSSRRVDRMYGGPTSAAADDYVFSFGGGSRSILLDDMRSGNSLSPLLVCLFSLSVLVCFRRRESQRTAPPRTKY